MKLLDTSVVLDNIDEDNYTPAVISIITVLEVLRGLDETKRSSTRQLLKESYTIINLDDLVIEAYCQIYNNLKCEGSLLADADLLIAATAIAHDLILDSKDAHFQRLEPFGLRVATTK